MLWKCYTQYARKFGKLSSGHGIGKCQFSFQSLRKAMPKNANRWRNSGNSGRLYFWGGSKITAEGYCSHEIKRHLLLRRKVMTNLDSILKIRDMTLPTEVCLVKAMVFPVVMWDLDYKESWALKSWCFWTMVLEKTLEIPLDCKVI